VSARELRDRLQRRARRADVTLTPPLVEGLEHYYRLLAKWNAKINLTGYQLDHEGADEAIDRLIVEPLRAVRHMSRRTGTMMDIGSGGGSPAIPMKLAIPSMALRLVEAKTRKAVFLRHAVRELGLSGVDVETTRYEELLTRPELHESLDLVTLRAVRVEARTLVALQAFLRTGGQLFLFRGHSGADVPPALPPGLIWSATYPLVENLRSRLVVLMKTALRP
jgi:16S rRNA (guanine527-N7)-methyltransferase